MSEVLTINTGTGLVQEQTLNPLPLYDENHPMLKQAIPEYTQKLPNANMSKLVAQLKMTMKKHGGVGLSANQCGVFERVFIIGTDYFQIACINPKIVAHSEEIVREKEGCLSYPGLMMGVPRHIWVDVEFTNEEGVVKQMRLDGVTARCYQHELDHMNGIRYTDKVGPVTIQLARQKQAKLIKKLQKQFKNKNGIFV